jgi:hypothetical protein
MSHNNHVIDNVNNDLLNGKSLNYYLDLIGDYVSPYPDPVVTTHDGVRVVRDDLSVGTKIRGGDLLAARVENERLVYVQPRTGLAGVSLLDVCKRRDKKLTLFMPSSKIISHHQACCVERGADCRFFRIAAMPVLNNYAKKWADEHGHYFVPLGLKHELVTAGLIAAALKIPEPEEVWTVVSTGVLTRALQIAWPNATFHAVAVARNMKSGELGRADVVSAPEPFQKAVNIDDRPPFPSVLTYDAKAWRYIPKNTGRDILFWNVGQNPTLNDESVYARTSSFRDWGDLSDFKRPIRDNKETVVAHPRVGANVG